MHDVLVDRIIGIGWDVGGWMGGKHGIAVAQWTVGSDKLQWLGSTVCSIAQGKVFTPHTLFNAAVKNISTEYLENSHIVIGIDAPLGYPDDFVKLVTGKQVAFERPAKEIDNRLAYRDTERYVHQTFGKKPLSATFDKLGNNATVAVYHIGAWCKDLGYSVHPIMEEAQDAKIIIEVYPALIKDTKGKALNPVKDLLPDYIAEGTDEADAAICAVMAIAYGANGRYSKLPRLIGPSKEWITPSKTEGWIYHLPK